MSSSWTRGLLPLAGCLLAGGVGLVVSFRHADALEAWAAEPQLAWTAASFACLLFTAALVATTYPQMRNPRLYALVALLLPLGAVHLVHHLDRPGQGAAARVVLGGGREVRTGDRTSPGPTRVRDDGEAASRRFALLPATVAKRYPELSPLLIRATAGLYSFSFLLLPLAVLAATPLARLGPAANRARLRLATLVLVALEVLLAAALLAWGPANGQASMAAWALSGSTGAAALVAILAWRSPAGLGGAVAGLVLFLLPVGLSAAGVSPSALGLELKSLPAGVERVLLLCFPPLLALLIGREWVVCMSHISQHDALTHIFNKAYAESIVNETTSMRLGSCYSVAILDIDFFKKVNDTHGHDAGDVVLREVAGAINATIAGHGLVCRTGGEEMTVFFPAMDSATARAKCEEVRLAVAALDVRATNNHRQRIRLQVTVSVGVASNLDPDGRPAAPGVREVVQAADKALYSAKAAGRNQVVVDG